MFPYKAGHGCGKLRKPVDERGRKQIDIVRPAVMAYIPDHLNALTPGCLEHGKKRREIVLPAPAVDEVPSHAVTRGADALAAQQLIVARGLTIVLHAGNHVQANSGRIDVGGTFVSAYPKRSKEFGPG